VICTFPECGRRKSAKGLCHAHYRQQQVGRPLTPIRKEVGFAGLSPEERKQAASRGGKAAYAKGVLHRWNSEDARREGIRGAAKRHGWSETRLNDALQRRGFNA
jgi:hypothetical protein